MNGPNPNIKSPIKNFPQVGFLKNYITSENIIVGDYTYYDDPKGPENFENNVLYHFPFIGDKLIIGKFCAIATGVQFIMDGANHKMSGFSTYPFYIFGDGWEKSAPKPEEMPLKGNTEIGHDVWIGYQATIMPGIKIGSGAIIAAKTVVTSDVPAYSVVGGNPSKVIKYRFEKEVIKELLEIAWWDWDVSKITQHQQTIVNCDLQALRRAKTD